MEDEWDYTEDLFQIDLKGTLGTFKTGSVTEAEEKQSSQHKSVEVKYLLTHVSLDPKSDQDKSLLGELAPFREIFNLKELEFDELMQRDIDDARVSGELIPYILNEQNQTAVQFFPPIVVLLLPTDGNKPKDYYDEVAIFEGDTDYLKTKKKLITRSGAPGSITFQLEQPILNNLEPEVHNFIRLRINSQRSKMVIVDGQHRAMALLALYRNMNINGWEGDIKGAYRHYYSHWTKSLIEKHDLKDIKLPIILCTLPELDTNYQNPDFNLKKAARSIFLTLNQNARPVSNSRNLLLDDNDLISSFLRVFLSNIKNRDQEANSAFRIYNIELDQTENRVKLQSTTAFSGIQHLHYIIEHLLLNSGDVNGVSARSGKFRNRKTAGYIEVLKNRLKSRDSLGDDANNTITRSHFTHKSESILSDNFDVIYGSRITKIFENLHPYSTHSRAVLALRELVESKSDSTIRSVFFDGQGVAKVFSRHLENLKELKESKNNPAFEEHLMSLQGKEKAISELEDNFKAIRFEKFCEHFTDKKLLKDGSGTYAQNVIKIYNDLFDDTFSTIAFQAAVVCGFFHIIEEVSNEFSGDISVNIDEELDNYITNINAFLQPNTFKKFKKLVCIFIGDLSGESADDLSLVEKSANSFRSLICRSEMQPDLWPKYRYVLLEIWHPINEHLRDKVQDELEECRTQVYKELVEDSLSKFKKENLKADTQVSEEEKKEIEKNSSELLREFIKTLSGKYPDKETFFVSV